MRKKGKKLERAEVELKKLSDKIVGLRDSVLEEFDLIELIEDSIKDVFSCDLNCATCTREEQGKCLQNFKVGNLMWLRKIAQDEWFIKDIVGKIDIMREALVEMMEKTKEYYGSKVDSSKIYEEHKDRIKDKLKNNRNAGYFS